MKLGKSKPKAKNEHINKKNKSHYMRLEETYKGSSNGAKPEISTEEDGKK